MEEDHGIQWGISEIASQESEQRPASTYTPMTIVAVLLVILSGLMNAIWNLLTKKSRDKRVFLGSIIVLSNIVLMPILFIELPSKSYPPEAWMLLALSMTAQFVYALLLSKVYTMGDLSQVYPIQRGTSVALIPLVGVFLLGESLSLWGWIGELVIVGGILFMSNFKIIFGTNRISELKPVLVAFSIGLCITFYVIIDKMTLEHFSPLLLLQMSNMGFMLGNAPALFKWKQVRTEWIHNWRTLLIGSVMMPGSYFLFLVAMKLEPVSYLTPIREVGTVFATLFGIWILKEQQGIKRIISAVCITLGIIIVGCLG